MEDLPKCIPRLYLYSKRDLLVSSEDVEDHIDESKQAGLQVAAEKWESTSHVGHAREGEGVRYWTAINHAWEAARVKKCNGLTLD